MTEENGVVGGDEAERRNVEMDEEFNNSSMFRNERNERSEMNDMNEINTRKMLLKSNWKGPCTENQRVMPEYSQSFDRGRNEHNVARQIDEPQNNAAGRIISFANHSLSEPRCSTRSVDVSFVESPNVCNSNTNQCEWKYKRNECTKKSVFHDEYGPASYHACRPTVAAKFSRCAI